MESLYFLIPLFFVIVFIFPLAIRLKLAADLNHNQVIVSVFLWKIKVITIKLYIRDNKIYLLTKKKKKEIEITLSIKQIYFVEQLGENLKDKVRPKKIVFWGKIGRDDAKNTAVTCGTIIIPVKSIFSYVKNYKPTCSMQANVQPSYEQNVFMLCVYLNFSITLFDLLFSLIISLFSLRSKAYGRQSKLS